MSLFGALQTGVSGLNAFSNAMAMISNNIANASTVGYKGVNASFSSLVTASGSGADFASGGVSTIAENSNDAQGVLEQTTSNTSLAISGNGYFVVRPAPNASSPVYYTRAGQFAPDNSGYLRNSAGMVLYGWSLANGAVPTANVSSLQPVNVSFLGGKTQPTTAVTASLNLNAGQAVDAATDFSRQVTVFDSLGASQTMTLNFTKTASNAWTLGVTDGAGNPLLPLVGGVHTVPVTFNSDGTVHQVNGVAATTPLTVAGTAGTGIVWGNGSTAQSINLNLNNITQYASAYNVVNITQDGAALGLSTGVSIDASGIVSATFSNGTNQKLYQLPLATFADANGLNPVSGNAYSESGASGDYNLVQANTAGAGTISPNSLETSNVDLATEFSKMIVTQNAYSANGKTISTANTMLQDLLNIIR